MRHIEYGGRLYSCGLNPDWKVNKFVLGFFDEVEGRLSWNERIKRTNPCVILSVLFFIGFKFCDCFGKQNDFLSCHIFGVLEEYQMFYLCCFSGSSYIFSSSSWKLGFIFNEIHCDWLGWLSTVDKEAVVFVAVIFYWDQMADERWLMLGLVLWYVTWQVDTWDSSVFISWLVSWVIRLLWW